jgi:hypothetical protein
MPLARARNLQRIAALARIARLWVRRCGRPSLTIGRSEQVIPSWDERATNKTITPSNAVSALGG